MTKNINAIGNWIIKITALIGMHILAYTYNHEYLLMVIGADFVLLGVSWSQNGKAKEE